MTQVAGVVPMANVSPDATVPTTHIGLRGANISQETRTAEMVANASRSVETAYVNAK